MKSLLWGLIVLVQIHGHRGCFEEERMDLLEIKEFVRFNKYVDKDHLLPSWVDNHEVSVVSGSKSTATPPLVTGSNSLSTKLVIYTFIEI